MGLEVFGFVILIGVLLVDVLVLIRNFIYKNNVPAKPSEEHQAWVD
jgi:hypothetical protein